MLVNEVLLELKDVDATEALGAAIASELEAGILIFLKGDLGAGKTSFVRGVLRSLGYEGAVKSPTYTILEEYSLAQKDIIHFDLYRMTDPEELDLIGIRDYFNGKIISFVEWPDRGVGHLPVEDLIITISHLKGGRVASLSANSEGGARMLSNLKKL